MVFKIYSGYRNANTCRNAIKIKLANKHVQHYFGDYFLNGTIQRLFARN